MDKEDMEINEIKPLENQSKSPEKLTKVSKKIARVERNEKGQLQKGSILNPEGLKEGTKQFHTLMDETVKEIAKLNNISEAEVWQVLIRRGYSEAKDGSYPFYKDILDRYFGKVQERIDLTTGGDKIVSNAETQAIIDKFEEELRKLKTNA